MSVNLAYVQAALLILASDDGITNSLSAQTNSGLLGALLTPENLSYASQTRLANDNGTGHTREVRIATKQRLTADDNEFLEMDGCEFGDEMPYLEETVTITQQSAAGFTISEAQIRLFPDLVSRLQAITGTNIPAQMVMIGRNMPEGRQIIQAIREVTFNFSLSYNSLVQKINKVLLNDFVSKVGNWRGGDPTKSYEVQTANAYASGGGSINPGALFRFKQDLRSQMLQGNAHTISGWGALDRVVAQNSEYFGQGANGVDYGSLVTNANLISRYFVDENIASVLGSEDDALIFMPGSANFLPYLKYVGTFGRIGTMDRFTMPVPIVPGLEVDVKILPNECDEIYEIKFGLHYELYIPEMDLFKATDLLAGVNGTLQATFTQGS
jgi:hypothetical protein